MSTEVASAYVTIGARVSALEAGLARADSRFKSSVDKADRRAASMSSTMARTMKRAAFGIGAGLGYAAKVSMDFEKQLAATSAVADTSATQLSGLKDQALKLGAASQFSAREVAAAQTQLVKGGVAVNQVIGSGTAAAVNLAAAGQMSMADAATTAANAMNLFAMSTAETGRIADVFATAANATTADVQDFAQALTQGGSAAKAAGYSFQDTMTVLEAMAAIGIKGSDAGTSVKTAMVQLLKPTAAAAAVMKKYNLNFVNSNGEMKRGVEIAAMLRNNMGTLTKAQRVSAMQTMAGTDGFRMLLALYDQGPGKLAKFERANMKVGTAAKVSTKFMATTAGQVEQLKGSLETLAISAGEALLPLVNSGAKELSSMFAGAAKEGSAFQSTVASIGSIIGTTFTVGVSAARALSPVLSGVSMALGVIGNSHVSTTLLGMAGGFLVAAKAAKMFSLAMNMTPIGRMMTLAGGLIGLVASLTASQQGAATSAEIEATAHEHVARALAAQKDGILNLSNAQIAVESAELGVVEAKMRRKEVQKQINGGTLKGAAADTAMKRANLDLRQAINGVTEAQKGRAKSAKEVLDATRKVQLDAGTEVNTARQRSKDRHEGYQKTLGIIEPGQSRVALQQAIAADQHLAQVANQKAAALTKSGNAALKMAAGIKVNSAATRKLKSDLEASGRESLVEAGRMSDIGKKASGSAGGVASLADSLANVGPKAQSSVGGVADLLSAILNIPTSKTVSFFIKTIGSVAAAVTSGGKKIPGKAGGGYVHGPRGTDRVLSWLSAGEAVLTTKQQRMVNSGYTVNEAIRKTGGAYAKGKAGSVTGTRDQVVEKLLTTPANRFQARSAAIQANQAKIEIGGGDISRTMRQQLQLNLARDRQIQKILARGKIGKYKLTLEEKANLRGELVGLRQERKNAQDMLRFGDTGGAKSKARQLAEANVALSDLTTSKTDDIDTRKKLLGLLEKELNARLKKGDRVAASMLAGDIVSLRQSIEQLTTATNEATSASNAMTGVLTLQYRGQNYILREQTSGSLIDLGVGV